MGDLEAAKQAFRTAYELDPEMQAASANLQLITKTIDSLALAQGLETEDVLDSKSSAEDFQEYTEVPDEKDQAQKSDKKYEGEGDVQEMVTKEVDENTIDIFEFDENIVIDKEAAKQTLLRQVTEDPSVFLRRKFAYQNRRRAGSIKKFEKRW